jgi:glycerol-3-phosphate acyltransferase PlsY
MQYVISAILGYIIGSFPTAYILLKQFKRIDITKAGSSNVGALNAYESSESNAIGGAVLIIDLLKGFLSVYFAKILYPGAFIFPALSLIVYPIKNIRSRPNAMC